MTKKKANTTKPTEPKEESIDVEKMEKTRNVMVETGGDISHHMITVCLPKAKYKDTIRMATMNESDKILFKLDERDLIMVD